MNQYMIEGFAYALEKEGFDTSASEMAHSKRYGKMIKAASAKNGNISPAIQKLSGLMLVKLAFTKSDINMPYNEDDPEDVAMHEGFMAGYNAMKPYEREDVEDKRKMRLISLLSGAYLGAKAARSPLGALAGIGLAAGLSPDTVPEHARRAYEEAKLRSMKTAGRVNVFQESLNRLIKAAPKAAKTTARAASKAMKKTKSTSGKGSALTERLSVARKAAPKAKAPSAPSTKMPHHLRKMRAET